MASPEDIRKLLQYKALRRGYLANYLNTEAPELVEIICPKVKYPALSDLERALNAEQEIRDCIDLLVEMFGKSVFGDRLHGFLLIVFGLDESKVSPNPSKRQTSQGTRLRAAETYVGLSYKTVEKHRNIFIEHLAVLLYKRLTPGGD